MAVFFITELNLRAFAPRAYADDTYSSTVQAVARCQDGLDAITGKNKGSGDLCKAPARSVPCTETDIKLDKMRIQVQAFDPKRSGCTVSLSPIKEEGNYRRLIHSQRGGLTYFDNGTGAAPTYFLYPRRNIPSVRTVLDQVELTTVTGDKLYYDAINVPTPSSGTIKPDKKSLSHTLILDVGVTRGNSPTMNGALSSTFEDPSGNRCTVKNSEIYRYDYFTSGKLKGSYKDKSLAAFNKWDPAPKYLTDSALWSFLAQRCPGLVLPSL